MRFAAVFRVGSSPTTGRFSKFRMVTRKTRNSCQPCGFFVCPDVGHITHFRVKKTILKHKIVTKIVTQMAQKKGEINPP